MHGVHVAAVRFCLARQSKIDMKTKKQLTLTIVHQHPRVLLGMKKRGFGAGRWNGFGGKLEGGETIEQGARREMLEEAGITLTNISKMGIILFEWKSRPEILEVHVFRSEQFSGIPRETEEMRPEWFHVDEIPFHEMWEDDQYWFPLLIANNKFSGRVLFDDQNKIIYKTFTISDTVA